MGITLKELNYKKNHLTIEEKNFIETAANFLVSKVPEKILGKHRKDFIIKLTKDERFIEKCLLEMYKDETN